MREEISSFVRTQSTILADSNFPRTLVSWHARQLSLPWACFSAFLTIPARSVVCRCLRRASCLCCICSSVHSHSRFVIPKRNTNRRIDQKSLRTHIVFLLLHARSLLHRISFTSLAISIHHTDLVMRAYDTYLHLQFGPGFEPSFAQWNLQAALQELPGDSYFIFFSSRKQFHHE